MPSAFRTQKNLSEWIELDYHQRQRKLRRWRRLLTWGTLVVCIAGVAGVSFLAHSPRLIQAGPLSSAHGMFNEDCARCHQESFQTAKKLIPWDSSVHVVSDSACSTCHEGAPHNLFAEQSSTCAGCHREHRGRISLTRVPNGQCLTCHSDLKDHRKGGADGLVFADVKGFAGDQHPEFGLHRNKVTDHGKLHFNHKAHLKPEGILGRNRKPVQLQCADCHRTDSAGRYMEPIRYENHCASCHPLAVKLTGTFKAEKAGDQERLNIAIKEFNATPAPHREPLVIRGALRERLLHFIQKLPVVEGDKQDALVDRDLFGKPGRRMPSDAEWRWVKQQLGGVEELLFTEQQKAVAEHVLFENGGGCRFCHIASKDGKEDGLPRYEPTHLISRWLTHARFSHDRHRMLDCAECHDAKSSSLTSDVLMPKLDSCQRCHNSTTGARHDCAECHTYHNRGLRQTTRKGMSIDECLAK